MIVTLSTPGYDRVLKDPVVIPDKGDTVVLGGFPYNVVGRTFLVSSSDQVGALWIQLEPTTPASGDNLEPRSELPFEEVAP